MKIFLDIIKKRAGDDERINRNHGLMQGVSSELEPGMDNEEMISIDDLNSETENTSEKENSKKSKKGTEEDDFIEVLYESFTSKTEQEGKKRNVKFPFNEINSFYKCKKKPKDSQVDSLSRSSPEPFSILKNDSILNESMQYWASKNDPTNTEFKPALPNEIERLPYLLDPGLCDDIALTMIGVRFRCPSCLLHDDKFRVVREHIIEAHQGFNQGDVDEFIDCLEPVKQTMKIGLVNVSQIEIENIVKDFDENIRKQKQKRETGKKVAKLEQT